MLLVACDHHFGQVSYKGYTRRQVRRNPRILLENLAPRRRKHKSVTREFQVDFKVADLRRQLGPRPSGGEWRIFVVGLSGGPWKRSRGRPPEANCNVVNGIPQGLRTRAPLRDVPGSTASGTRSIGLSDSGAPRVLGERRHRSARTTTEGRDYKIDGALFTQPQFTPISVQPAGLGTRKTSSWPLVGATSKVHVSVMPNAGPSPSIYTG